MDLLAAAKLEAREDFDSIRISVKEAVQGRADREVKYLRRLPDKVF